MTSKSVTKICSVEGCYQPSAKWRKGMCEAHYMRVRTYGDPHFVLKKWLKGDTPEERFWSGVQIVDNHEDCWLWIGSTFDSGYGQIMFEGKNRRAHIIAWEITNGRKASMSILHSCDVRRCCNPSHLREGTHDDNMADKLERNRQSRGEQHGLARVTEEVVREIRRRYVPGRQKPNPNSCAALGKEFGLSRAATWAIIDRKTWTHIK